MKIILILSVIFFTNHFILAQDKEQSAFEETTNYEYKTDVNSSVFSENGKVIYSMLKDGRIGKWNWNEDKEPIYWQAHNESYGEIAIFEDKIATCSQDSLKVWNAEGKLLHFVKLPTKKIEYQDTVFARKFDYFFTDFVFVNSETLLLSGSMPYVWEIKITPNKIEAQIELFIEIAKIKNGDMWYNTITDLQVNHSRDSVFIAAGNLHIISLDTRKGREIEMPITSGFTINTISQDAKYLFTTRFYEEENPKFFVTTYENGINADKPIEFENRYIIPEITTFLNYVILWQNKKLHFFSPNSNSFLWTSNSKAYNPILCFNSYKDELFSTTDVYGKITVWSPNKKSTTLEEYLYYWENENNTDNAALFYPVALPTISFIRGQSNQLEKEDEGKKTIQLIADLLNKTKELKIKIISHTDTQGQTSINLKLSQDRSIFLKKLLIAQGVQSDRIFTEGKGDTKPVIVEYSDVRNRRAEILLFK